jgi:hypothetical protein
MAKAAIENIFDTQSLLRCIGSCKKVIFTMVGASIKPPPPFVELDFSG